MGKALHRYGMIADGDRILVGLSGGPDSMTLLWVLRDRLRRVPVHYELHAVYIDPGFEGGFGEQLACYCREAGWPLTVQRTDDGLVAHSEENRENPCFLCSLRRRRRLFELADELGCAKIALGHNRDDVVETFFMNMCYAGEISTMRPCQDFFNGRFTVIRPLAYTEAHVIRRFARERGFPRFENPCPSAGNSKRRQIRDWLQQQYRTNRKIRGNIFRALHNVRQDYLLK